MVTKSPKSSVEIERLDEYRYAVTLDGLVRYVGRLEECERRANILLAKSDRGTQDQALGGLSRRLNHGFAFGLRG
jgi:hypothetical protein